MEKTFRPYEPRQDSLFPRRLDEYVREGDLSLFIRELVMEELDLREVYDGYAESQGAPPYNPTMMTGLLLYAYSQGIYGSRRIARACEQRVDFLVITAHEKPDYRTVAKFRKRHGVALSGLFFQVLELCVKAGLVKLGHVALDGTKIRANASKHKAMSYGRMPVEDARLAASIKEWFAKSDETDREEDELYGADKSGDELPSWVANKQERRERIRLAKLALEEQAREQATKSGSEPQEGSSAKDPDDDNKPQLPPKNQSRKKKGQEHLPHEKDQFNFSDPESSIMKTRGTFEQCYNAQAAVDSASQVIVAQGVTNAPNDTAQLSPILEQMEQLHTLPEELSADAGYFTEQNLELLEQKNINGYVAPGREGKRTNGSLAADSLKAKMATKIRKAGHRSRYRLRKQTVEPVFGQIKHARGFRQFLRNGLNSVKHEWSLVCSAHNLLKLAQARVG